MRLNVRRCRCGHGSKAYPRTAPGRRKAQRKLLGGLDNQTRRKGQLVENKRVRFRVNERNAECGTAHSFAENGWLVQRHSLTAIQRKG